MFADFADLTPSTVLSITIVKEDQIPENITEGMKQNTFSFCQLYQIHQIVSWGWASLLESKAISGIRLSQKLPGYNLQAQNIQVPNNYQ